MKRTLKSYLNMEKTIWLNLTVEDAESILGGIRVLMLEGVHLLSELERLGTLTPEMEQLTVKRLNSLLRLINMLHILIDDSAREPDGH